MHPLLDSIEELSDSEVEQKIVELQRKYFQSRNPHIQQQIVMCLDAFKEEARARQRAAYEKSIQNSQEDGNDLDSLINVN